MKSSARATVMQRYPHAYAFRWAGRWTVYATPASGDPLCGRALGDGKTASLAWRDAAKRTAPIVSETDHAQRLLPCLGPELYRHDKTGGVYEVICNATTESTGELLVIYRNTATGERWARPATEFNDGRFVRLIQTSNSP